MRITIHGQGDMLVRRIGVGSGGGSHLQNKHIYHYRIVFINEEKGVENRLVIFWCLVKRLTTKKC